MSAARDPASAPAADDPARVPAAGAQAAGPRREQFIEQFALHNVLAYPVWSNVADDLIRTNRVNMSEARTEIHRANYPAPGDGRSARYQIVSGARTDGALRGCERMAEHVLQLAAALHRAAETDIAAPLRARGQLTPPVQAWLDRLARAAREYVAALNRAHHEVLRALVALDDEKNGAAARDEQLAAALTATECILGLPCRQYEHAYHAFMETWW